MNIQTAIDELDEVIRSKHRVRDTYLKSDNQELQSIGLYLELVIEELYQTKDNLIAVRNSLS